MHISIESERGIGRRREGEGVRETERMRMSVCVRACVRAMARSIPSPFIEKRLRRGLRGNKRVTDFLLTIKNPKLF